MYQRTPYMISYCFAVPTGLQHHVRQSSAHLLDGFTLCMLPLHCFLIGCGAGQQEQASFAARAKVEAAAARQVAAHAKAEAAALKGEISALRQSLATGSGSQQAEVAPLQQPLQGVESNTKRFPT